MTQSPRPLITGLTNPSSAVDLLLPKPKRLHRREDIWKPVKVLTVESSAGCKQTLSFLQRRLDRLGFCVKRVEPGGMVAIRLRVEREQLDATQGPRQGYRLVVGESGADLVGEGEAGVFYAACTLVQWIEIHQVQGTCEVPGIDVYDAPDFLHRGVMLDISRNRVPTVETVEGLVETLSGWKINQIQLYTEHTFAYVGHEIVWQKASPWTGEELRRLDAFCRERYVELVPNQNSFGHFHRWLVHEPYRDLAECPDGIEHPFSPEPEPFSLCPIDPRSLDLLRDLYGQMLPHFSSRLFNVGLDETLDLGQGRSAAVCEEHGRERVYLDFLTAVHGLAAMHGRRMMFWGDVILNRPELIDELPRDAIALEWGYEADHPFAEDAARFAASGLDFYVCPGTSSWNSLAGRVRNAVLNLASAARHGREKGALGYLITDWGDHGHLQPLPVSYPGFVAGAAFAWSAETAEQPMDLPLASLLDLHIYRDRAHRLGRLSLELGEVYRLAGGEPSNGSVLFFLTFFGPKELVKRNVEKVTPEHLRRVLRAIEAATPALSESSTEHPETEAWHLEFEWLIEMLRFACRFGIERLGEKEPSSVELGRQLDHLSDTFKAIWRRRNREGGLTDSLARLDSLRRWI